MPSIEERDRFGYYLLLLEEDQLVDVGLADFGAPEEEHHPHLNEGPHDKRHCCDEESVIIIVITTVANLI